MQFPSSHSRMHSVFAVTQSSTHSSDANSFGHSSFFAPNAAIIHNDNVKTLILTQELNLKFKINAREIFRMRIIHMLRINCLLS